MLAQAKGAGTFGSLVSVLSQFVVDHPFSVGEIGKKARSPNSHRQDHSSTALRLGSPRKDNTKSEAQNLRKRGLGWGTSDLLTT